MLPLVLLLVLLNSAVSCPGKSLPHIYLSPTKSPKQPSSIRRFSFEFVMSISASVPPAPRKHRQRWTFRLPLHASPAPGPTPAPSPTPLPSPSPTSPGVFDGPRGKSLSGRHHHHNHVDAPSPTVSGCDQICLEPFTLRPMGSPCGCVRPMKVKLILDVALYSVFPVVSELEIEIASGIYLKQSQVKIMGASSDDQNQEKTVVDVNLVPLGNKFDNTTAWLMYERFLRKKIFLNATRFGNYKVACINYPGIPSLSSYVDVMGKGPSASAGGLPITANFVEKNERMNPRTISIIAVSAFVFILVCSAAVFLLIKWRKKGKPSSSLGPVFTSSINKQSGTGSMLSSSMASSIPVSLMFTMPTCMLSVKTFTLAEVEKATEKFNSKWVLGEGGFGRVYRGILEGTEVAVKLLTRDRQSGDREFIAEVEMLSRLHHRNLVKLIGICIEQQTRCLVYELIHNGSLESHLHGADQREGILDWDTRMKIALGAARGLAYLHEDSNPRVIHRDFKASNVLLEDDFTPKVSDFGLAREATEGSHHISTRVMGTFGYVAPEYAMTGHLLVKSDVYSYGVVLLELLTGRKPVDMSQSQGQENLVTWARPLLTSREGLEQLIDPSLTGSYTFDDMAKVAAIASMCVHQEVTHRPFMGEVVQALKLIYNDAGKTCEDCFSQMESSGQESDFRADLGHSDRSWWDAGASYGHRAPPLMTMDYSSGPLDEIENGPATTDGASLPAGHGNLSGPLRVVRRNAFFYKLTGSMSEPGGFQPRRVWRGRYLG